MTYWYISLISEFLEQLLQPSAYQPLPLEMEKAGENELGLLRRPLHARLGQSTGVKVQSLFVSQIFLDTSQIFLETSQIFLDCLRFLTLSLISGAGGSHIPFNSGRFTLKNNFPKRS